MPFIPVDETVRVTITYTDTAGNEAVNVIHCRADGTSVTVPLMNDLLDAIEIWLGTYWAPLVSNQARAIRLEALDLTVDNSFYVSRTIDEQGTDPGAMLPPQDTVAISLRSVYSGRSRRGRLFHYGLLESRQDGGYIDPTSMTAFVTLYEQLMTGIAGVGWLWVVVSYVADGVPRAEGLTTVITSIVITDNIVDSMDTRKPRA